MTTSLRWPIAGLALAVLAAACSSGTESSDPAGPSEAPTTIDSALVELPPPPTTQPAPAPTAPPETTTSSATAVAPSIVELGAWDWGAPCRVPVEETIAGTGPLVQRNFVIVVSGVGADYKFEFEDVETSAGQMTEAELATHLLDRGAVLPDMIVDAEGNFLRFENLSETVEELTSGAGPAEPDDWELQLLGDQVRDATIGQWYGVWLGRGALSEEPQEAIEQRALGSVGYPATVRVSGEQLVRASAVERFGEGRALLLSDEFGDDLETIANLFATADEQVDAIDPVDSSDAGEPQAGSPEAEVETIAINRSWFGVFDPLTLRPEQSTFRFSVKITTGERSQPWFDYEVRTEFDWLNAEGCE